MITFMEINYINDKNVPFIKFGDLKGEIIYKLNFENDTLFGFYNQYAFIDEKTDVVIGNINSQIKIWKPVV